MADKQEAVDHRPTAQKYWNNEYGAIATDHSICGDDTQCAAIMRQLGYTDEMLAPLPSDCKMGIGCGSPTRYLSLEPGMMTLDIGSGAGCDTILCGLRVQDGRGRAIGLDILPAMQQRATRNVLTVANLGWARIGDWSILTLGWRPPPSLLSFQPS